MGSQVIGLNTKPLIGLAVMFAGGLLATWDGTGSDVTALLGGLTWGLLFLSFVATVCLKRSEVSDEQLVRWTGFLALNRTILRWHDVTSFAARATPKGTSSTYELTSERVRISFSSSEREFPRLIAEVLRHIPKSTTIEISNSSPPRGEVIETSFSFPSHASLAIGQIVMRGVFLVAVLVLLYGTVVADTQASSELGATGKIGITIALSVFLVWLATDIPKLAKAMREAIWFSPSDIELRRDGVPVTEIPWQDVVAIVETGSVFSSSANQDTSMVAGRRPDASGYSVIGRDGSHIDFNSSMPRCRELISALLRHSPQHCLVRVKV